MDAEREAGGAIPPVPLPESFAGTLRPYQAQGVAWLQFRGSRVHQHLPRENHTDRMRRIATIGDARVVGRLYAPGGTGASLRRSGAARPQSISPRDAAA